MHVIFFLFPFILLCIFTTTLKANDQVFIVSLFLKWSSCLLHSQKKERKRCVFMLCEIKNYTTRHERLYHYFQAWSIVELHYKKINEHKLEHTTALLGTKDSKIKKREKTKNERKQKVKNHGIPKIGMEILGCLDCMQHLKRCSAASKAAKNSGAERCREMGK